MLKHIIIAVLALAVVAPTAFAKDEYEKKAEKIEKLRKKIVGQKRYPEYKALFDENERRLARIKELQEEVANDSLSIIRLNKQIDDKDAEIVRRQTELVDLKNQLTGTYRKGKPELSILND